MWGTRGVATRTFTCTCGKEYKGSAATVGALKKAHLSKCTKVSDKTATVTTVLVTKTKESGNLEADMRRDLVSWKTKAGLPIVDWE
jgi:hypothetical protein